MKKSSEILIGLATMVVAICASAEQSIPTLEELDVLFDEARLDLRAPGLVYGVVIKGETPYIKSFGQRRISPSAPVTGKTRFSIASMTKMMTALLVLDLQDLGKLSIDAAAERYITAMKDWAYPTADSRRVTVRDLLQHTAGFVSDNPWADRQVARSNQELDEIIRRADPFSHAPGEAFEYSNFGYVLLGRIIENVSGESFSDRVRGRIFDPLEMRDSIVGFDTSADHYRSLGYNYIGKEFVVEPEFASGAFDSLGGVWTTAEDYSKFVAWVLSAWPARDDPDVGLIPRRVVRALAESAVITEPATRPGVSGQDDCVMSSGYGMGVGVRRHCAIGLTLSHGGGFPGFGSYVVLAPEKGIGVFGFANRTYAEMYGPVWDAVSALTAADARSRDLDELYADVGLLTAYKQLGKAYSAKDIRAAGLVFSDNFFQDRSYIRWNRQLEDLHNVAGNCDTDTPISHHGRLSGEFIWPCENARIYGAMSMSPVDSNATQMLHLRTMTRDENGRDLNRDYNWH